MMKSAYHALIGYIQIKDGFNFCFWVGQKMPWIQDPYPLEYLEQAWWIVDIIFLKTAKSYGNNNYKRSWNSREVDLFKLSWQPPAFIVNLSFDAHRGVSVRKSSSRLLVVTQKWYDRYETSRAPNTKPLFPWDMFLCLGLLMRCRNMRAYSSQKADLSLLKISCS